MQELLFLEPVKKQTIWGGASLAAEYGFGMPGEPIAEAWAVSAHPAGDCVIAGGAYGGKTLGWLWEQMPQLFACPEQPDFPLLVKFIDAASDLSIQVHPDDAYASVHEPAVNGRPCRGKSECWYILHAEPGARLVLGHNAQSREQAQAWIAAGKWEQLLREVPVKAGDFFRIDPGTVHAIGGGIRILEVQQSSDITYRLYDYGRLQNGKPRPLHIEKSLDVMTVPAAAVAEERTALPVQVADGEARLILLESCPYFTVEYLELNGNAVLPEARCFRAVTVLEGEGTVNGTPVQKGQSFLVPHGIQALTVNGSFTAILSQPV